MILTCQSCTKSYNVAEGSIGTQGRNVRCSSCQHVWFETHANDRIIPETYMSPAAPLHKSPLDGRAEGDRRTFMPVEHNHMQHPQAHHAEATAPIPAMGFPEYHHTQENEEYGHSEYGHKRSNGTFKRVLIVVLILLAVVAGALALLNFLAPSPFNVLRTAMGVNPVQNPSSLVLEKSASITGNKVVIHTKIINTSASAQQVPGINVKLLGVGEKVLQSWSIPPSQTMLAGNGSSFEMDNTRLDVPADAKSVRIELGTMHP